MEKMSVLNSQKQLLNILSHTLDHQMKATTFPKKFLSLTTLYHQVLIVKD